MIFRSLNLPLRCPKSVLRAVGALYALTVFCAQAAEVSEIRFLGNEKTVDQTMLTEIEIRPGDDVTREDLDKARQSIMDLGLFKKVEAELDANNVLTFTVEEKHYWFVLPRLSRSGDGDISYGMAYRMHNLRGRNETLVKISVTRSACAIPTRD